MSPKQVVEYEIKYDPPAMQNEYYEVAIEFTRHQSASEISDLEFYMQHLSRGRSNFKQIGKKLDVAPKDQIFYTLNDNQEMQQYHPLEKIVLPVFEEKHTFILFLKIDHLGERNIAVLLKYRSKVVNPLTNKKHSLNREKTKSFIVNIVPPFSLTHEITQQE